MNRDIQILRLSPEPAVPGDVLAAVYGPDPAAWPEAVIPDENLYACLKVFRNGGPRGYLAVYNNPGILHQDKATMQLGNFECINDAEVAKALLDAACGIASEQDAAVVLGPMEGSTWNNYRFKTSSAGVPAFITEMQHPAYYPELWQLAGFRSVASYVSNRATVMPVHEDSVFFTDQGLTVRRLDPERLEAELDHVYPLCHAAFAQSPYFSPIPREAFVAKLMQLKPLLGKSFTRIVDDAQGTPQAFILCLPDMLASTGRRLIVKTAAKSPDCHITGLITMLNQSIMNEAYDEGFREAIHAFIHVNNRSLRRSHQFAGRTIRKYSLFAKACR